MRASVPLRSVRLATRARREHRRARMLPTVPSVNVPRSIIRNHLPVATAAEQVECGLVDGYRQRTHVSIAEAELHHVDVSAAELRAAITRVGCQSGFRSATVT